jgi:O-succinylhomoserine sulfhydrylase
MSAILSLCMGLLRTGDHVICSLGVFGTTSSLFANQLSRFGVHTDFVSPTDVDAWAGAMRPETQMLFLETPSNPLTEVADIRALADLAHAHDARLVVDNCFCTSALQRPLDWGADIVSHSATKYLDGQGRCVGGALVGDADTLDRHIFPVLRTAGPTMSPFNAWVFLKGLETLNLRMRAHSEQAAALAEWLRSHPAVTRVFYSGLADHPQHALAARQQKAFGGIVSFEVAGGRAAAWSVIDHTRMLSITANLGDTRSTITHPATTTHGRVPADQREAMGIQEGLVRVSVGLEDLTDIQTDLDHGLSRIRQGG